MRYGRLRFAGDDSYKTRGAALASFPRRESAVTISAQFPWIQAGVPALVLAPMEGVMDAAMRALLYELGGFTFCVAEFIRFSQAVPRARHRGPSQGAAVDTHRLKCAR